jgi:phosphatidylinositol glycan class M
MNPPRYRAVLLSLLSYPRCFAFGLFLRFVLLGIGSYIDATSSVRYTDVDYSVYSDAARAISEGRSPYERATYRYTPLLAAMSLPGVLYPLYGKLMFCLVDLVLAWCVRQLLLTRGLSDTRATRYGALSILLNPLVMNVSTRGNADSIIVALVVGVLLMLLQGRCTRQDISDHICTGDHTVPQS